MSTMTTPPVTDATVPIRLRRATHKRRTMTTGRRVFSVINAIVLTTFALVCVLPFVNVLASSLATPGELATRPFILWPQTFSLDAYRYILSTPTIFRALGVSFIVVKSLGMIDSLWSLIIPVAINAFNFIIMRSFFQGIPESLEEAARIDGCSELGVFFRIVLPLSLASIATIGLFYAVYYWNTYQNAILYINSSELWPIQVLLRQIVVVASGLNADESAVDIVPPAQSIRMAVIFVATLPMLLVYPFVQRFFVKGALVGSVKG